MLCYSEECYIMARCAFMSFDKKGQVIINLKKKHRAALWQLVGGSIPAKAIFHPGQHQGLHETLDKGRLAGAHRPHYADIDVAVRSLGYALINVRDLTYHFQPFLSPANGKAVIVVCSTV